MTDNDINLFTETPETEEPISQETAPVSAVPEATTADEAPEPPEIVEDAPRMIPYNSGMPKLVMPEYGRNIQNLVEYCITIQDRTERTDCALAIADIMARAFPYITDGQEDRKKIYDQMQIMSGFRLDVDFPIPAITREEANPQPARLPYQHSRIRFRHYGSSVERMVNEVCKMENSEEKDEMVYYLANHMKKLLTIHNKENATDAKVLHDLAIFSLGHIMLEPETYPLMEFEEEPAPAPTTKKRNKKKR